MKATPDTSTYLIQILLPLYSNTGKHFSRVLYQKVEKELSRRFSGLTAYSRAPAKGLWRSGSETKRDDIIVYEVMVAKLDSTWWKAYRKNLEKRFRQNSVIVRASTLTLL
jgi:hypothetical protein